MPAKFKKIFLIAIFIGLLIITASCKSDESNRNEPEPYQNQPSAESPRNNNDGTAAFEAFEAEIAALESRNAALVSENYRLAAENNLLEKENSQLENRNDFLEKEIYRNEREINRLEREINRTSNTGLILNIILISFNIVWALVNKFNMLDKLKDKVKNKKSKTAPEIKSETETKTESKTETGENLL